jgi:hypothetical protein
VILFELLHDRRPANMPSVAAPWTARRHPTDSPTDPRLSDRAIPRVLDRICRKALAPDREHRYSDARALAEDLDRWLQRHQRGWSLPRPLVAFVLGSAAAPLLMLGLQGTFPPAEQPPTGRAPAASIEMPRLSPSIPAIAPIKKSPRVVETNDLPESDTPGRFVGNHKTGSYHVPSCPNLVTMLPPDRINIASVSEAKSRKFRPCTICNPQNSEPGQTGPGVGSNH